jgi:hypothetical protein
MQKLELKDMRVKPRSQHMVSSIRMLNFLTTNTEAYDPTEDNEQKESLSGDDYSSKMDEIKSYLGQPSQRHELGSDPEVQKDFLAKYERYIAARYPGKPQNNVLHVMA